MYQVYMQALWFKGQLYFTILLEIKSPYTLTSVPMPFIDFSALQFIFNLLLSYLPPYLFFIDSAKALISLYSKLVSRQLTE